VRQKIRQLFDGLGALRVGDRAVSSAVEPTTIVIAALALLTAVTTLVTAVVVLVAAVAFRGKL